MKFDPLSAKHKKPFFAIYPFQICELFLEDDTNADNIFLLLHGEDGYSLSQPLERVNGGHRASFSLPKCGLYFYHFRCGDVHLGRNDNTHELSPNGDEWQITCVPEKFQTPSSFHGRIAYQIFPDRFYRSSLCQATEKLTPFLIHESVSEAPFSGSDANGNYCYDFYGGNVRGITEKLPYLRELGISLLYLNPIFYAYSNHRYDTADFMKIDPLLGTEEDFIILCKEAHANGMAVILDGVFSHVGRDSIYFDALHRFGNGAVSNPDSPYREWFTFQEYPNTYTCWWSIPTLPCVNEMTPSYLSYIITDENSVIAHWLSLGADGFRLDVADELPDAFLSQLRARMKALKPESLLIGEVWEDASNKISYGLRKGYFTNGLLDSVTNYPFRESILKLIYGELDAICFCNSVMTLLSHYPRTVIPCLLNSLSTHDTPRIRQILKEHGGKDALFAAVFLQFMLPGIPCIYYGDEIGMMGGADPSNRAYFTWEQTEEDIYRFTKDMCALRSSMRELQTDEIAIEALDGAIHIKRGANLHAILFLTPKFTKPNFEGSLLYSRLHEPPAKFDFILYQEKNS